MLKFIILLVVIERLLVDSGVPQGSLLGPIIFSIFTSDLRYNSNYCVTIKYADDNIVVLLMMYKSECNAHISSIVNYLSEFCATKGLHLNLNNLLLCLHVLVKPI